MIGVVAYLWVAPGPCHCNAWENIDVFVSVRTKVTMCRGGCDASQGHFPYTSHFTGGHLTFSKTSTLKAGRPPPVESLCGKFGIAYGSLPLFADFIMATIYREAFTNKSEVKITTQLCTYQQENPLISNAHLGWRKISMDDTRMKGKRPNIYRSFVSLRTKKGF